MTMSKKNQQLIETVNRQLSEGQTWEQIASGLDMPLGTLHDRIRRLGYRTRKSLAPIHAPELPNNSDKAI